MAEISEEERRARRLGRYQIHLQYINDYREGDVIYHVSVEENIASLLRTGFDPSRIGSGGGCQGGAGFSGAWCEADAWDWGRRLYGWGNEHLLAVVKVSLPGMKLASQQECDEMAQRAVLWGRENGFLQSNESGEDAPTEKLQALYQNQTDLANLGWALIGQYILTQGYDGYFVGSDEVVIMNFALLKPEAFSLCS